METAHTMEANLSHMDFASRVNHLKWLKFPVLNDGFICLVDIMGDDESIVQAARVSYNRDNRDDQERFDELAKKMFPGGGSASYRYPNYPSHKPGEGLTAPEIGRVFAEQERLDAKLIRYLMRHRHTTPFEMAELKFLVRVPMDCWRQWIRHRTANVNEYSTRYTTAIDSRQETDSTEWRSQAKNNKQGSGDFLDDLDTGARLSTRENQLHLLSDEIYQERLDAGVAKEQARKDLPLSTYTEAYWKMDLHNLLHFLSLRMDSHAQKEIRDYATIIGEQIVAPLYPAVWSAFRDYRLGGMFLSKLDREMIGLIAQKTNDYSPSTAELKIMWCDITNDAIEKPSRERSECFAKLERLGLIELDA